MNLDILAGEALALLLTYAIHSSVLLGAAALLTRSLRSRYPGLAESLWRAALLLPPLSALLQTLLVAGAAPLPLPLPEALGSPRGTPRAGGPSLAVLLLAGWLAVALGSVVRLVLAYRALGREAARRRLPLPARLRSLETPDARVVASPAVALPQVLNGEIHLPPRALRRLSRAELRSVVAHEAAHLRRHDAAWSWAAALSVRVFFFQPLNRLAAARLRELAEFLCDEAAVAATGSPAPLARALLRAGQWLAREPSLAAGPAPALAGAESLTLRRVRRLLAGRARPPRRPAAAWVLAPLAALGLLAGLTRFAPRVVAALAPLGPYTINAEDPAGRFSLTIERGRVIAATLDGRPLPDARVRQRGSSLQLLSEDARPLAVRLTARGGITWQARTPNTPSSIR